MKSNVSDHLELVQAVYIDACAKCTADVSDLRDLETIRSRVEYEGISFLTITLPAFCRDFERSLASGKIDSTWFPGFRKHGAIPAFLQGMLSRLFDRETGRLHNEIDDPQTLVESVRQICLLFKKIELPCSEQRNQAAVANFIEVERINSEFEASEEQLAEFRSVSSVLWHNMLADIQPDMLVPRHGPGATAERISGNQKYVIRFWYERLDRFFPLVPNAYVYSALDNEDDTIEKVAFVPEQEEHPVRVTLVPKTLKSPRIIAIEPVCMQYAQQAIQACLYDKLESYWLTRRHVNFRDQTINQKLAMTASKTGQLATIDLSDASDRVPLSLVKEMFAGNPWLWDAIDACRSRNAELPDGTYIGPLQKFASMGSALCFPIESMYFYTICVAALLKRHNLPVNPRNVYHVSRRIWVYGDDIVVPTDSAVTVLDHLKKYNCKVNDSKTFYTGKFRESCGVDAYDGGLVTPIYIRKERPQNRQSATEILSWNATANLFYLKGYWHTASFIHCMVERILGHLPYKSPDSSAVGRISFLGYRTIDGWHGKLHAYIQKAWVPQVVYSSDEVDGYSALQKCLLSLERRSRKMEDVSDWGRRHYETSSLVADQHHLERSARRGAVVLRLRWVPST